MACELGQVPRIWAAGSACEARGGVPGSPPERPALSSNELGRPRSVGSCAGQTRARRGDRVENREAGARLNAQRTVLDSKTRGEVQASYLRLDLGPARLGAGPREDRAVGGARWRRAGSGKRPIVGREPRDARPPRPAGPRPAPRPSRPRPRAPTLLPWPLTEAVRGAESGYLVRAARVSFVRQARSSLPRCPPPARPAACTPR